MSMIPMSVTKHALRLPCAHSAITIKIKRCVLLPTRILSLNSESVTKIKDKTLLFPGYDPLTSKLVEAVFIKEGIDARMVPLTEKIIQRGLRSK